MSQINKRPARTTDVSLVFRAMTCATLLLATTVYASAQTPTEPKDPTTGVAPAAGTSVVTGEAAKSPPEKHVDAAKSVDFVDLGAAIAAPTLKLPAGAESVRRVSAPIGGGTDTVLLNFYKLSGGLYVDVLTSTDNQSWTKRNHLALKGDLPIRPDKMNVTMRYLQPSKKNSFLIVASDESADLAMTFPAGFGGKAGQQIFLVQSASGTRHSYKFGDLDSRGYAIVREDVDSTGQVKPADDTQYFVWNGRKFIMRKAN